MSSEWSIKDWFGNNKLGFPALPGFVGYPLHFFFAIKLLRLGHTKNKLLWNLVITYSKTTESNKTTVSNPGTWASGCTHDTLLELCPCSFSSTAGLFVCCIWSFSLPIGLID